jgi:hypothetical protein
MSGWDKPSRPTWDPQDGPEDSTQAFPAPDGPGADDRWSQPAGPGWGGTASDGGQDLGRGDFDAPGFGAPGLGRGGSDLGPADYDRADRREPAFPPEPNGFPSDQNGFSRGGPSLTPPPDFFPQEFEQRKPGATLAGRDLPGRDLPSRDLPSRDLPGRDLPSRGGYGSGPQASARDEPPWPGPARQESARQESARPDYGRPAENGRTGDYGRPADYGRLDLGRVDFDRPAAQGQDFPRRDPGRSEFSAYSTYSGQPEQAEQAPPPVNQADTELAARMDPALQDFFAPTKPDPRYAGGRPSQAALPPALPGPGQSGPGQPGPGQPGLRQSGPMRANPGQEPPHRGGRGDGRGPRRPGRAAATWENPAGYPTGGQPALRRPGSPGGRRDDDSSSGSRRNLIIAVAAVIVIIVGVGGYLVLKPSGNSNPTASAGSTPTTSASTPASSPAATPKATGATGNAGTGAGSATSAGAYVLSTPSTASGYPIGADPHFLATATSTVATIEQTAVNGGAGTAAGSPVSASYTLPDAQTIEFVGYQGTFNPTAVMANLKAYGSSEASYPAGPNGGELACANTTATASTPSGAVCVWVTKSTLGFTEFFTQASGPEALNSAQSKGAQDTVSLRASVEKLKS